MKLIVKTGVCEDWCNIFSHISGNTFLHRVRCVHHDHPCKVSEGRAVGLTKTGLVVDIETSGKRAD